MPAHHRMSGPWYQRAAVWIFSILLGLLVFWLLGFIVGDLATWPGPRYEEVEQQVVDRELLERERSLQQQLSEVEKDILATQQRQANLRDSTDSTQRTMNQLLEIQRLAIEKGQEVSEREKESLNEAKELFLTAQKQYQEINQQSADLQDRRRQLIDQQEQLRDELAEQELVAREKYQRLYEWHEIKMAGLKLAVLIPLLIAAAVLYLRNRGSVYLPLWRAIAIAVAAHVMLVMHSHFPQRYFKYILILTAIAVVVWILVWMLRRVARPPADWLLKQYREGYERLICPICEYPIRRGPLRYHFWTRRSIKQISRRLAGTEDAAEERYSCPVCATALYIPCTHCEHIRPALLPACPHCGAEHPAAEIAAAE